MQPLHRMGSSTAMPYGPLHTALILTFLDQLHNITAANQIDHMQYIVVWDNVSFHRSALVQNWFQQHPHFTVLYLPPYSPFLNPIEEFFSAWRWKVYDLRLQAEVPLIQAMEEACDQMEVAAMQGWIRHSDVSFQGVLLMTTLPAMLMKFSGQIQLGEETMSSFFFFFFTVNLQYNT